MAITDFIDLSGVGIIMTRILQLIGGVIVLYVIVWIINIILNRNKNKLIKKILIQVEEMNKNLKILNKKLGGIRKK